MSSNWFDRRPLLILLGLSALFYWKLTFSDRFTFLDSPDLTGQVLPWYNYQAQVWNDGKFPLWDPYVWGGQPLLGQMQPGAAFPFNWPMFMAPLGEDGRIDFRWIHLQYAAMHLLAAWFAFGLARQLGTSRFAAVLAGLAFACSGYLGSVGWPQMANGAIWLPLTLLLFHRAAQLGWNARGAAYAVLCGGSVGMSLLSGHHQTPFFGLLGLCTLFAYFFWERARDSTLPALRFGLLFGVVAGSAFLVAALQLLPAFEYASDAYRWVSMPNPVGPDDSVPYVAHAEHKLYPITLLGLTLNRAIFQVNTFVGWLCLLLAIYAIATRWSERWVRVYAAGGLAALVFAFGPLGLLHGWVYQFIPLADKARSSGHAVYVFQLCLFVLAAFGVDRLMERHAEDDRGHFRFAQRLLLGYAAVAWFALYLKVPEGVMEANPGDYVMLSALSAVVLAALLEGWRRGALSPPAMRFAVIALLLAENYPTQWIDFSDLDDPNRQEHIGRYRQFAAAMDYLHQQPGPFRIEIVPDGGSVNVGEWNRIEQVDGFLASSSRPMYDLFAVTGWPEGRDLLNRVYTIAKEPQRDTQVEVYSDNDWKVFRNPEAHPRARLVHDNAHITTAAGDPAPRPPSCEDDEQAVMRRWDPHRLLIDVRAGCEAYLIVADPADPGWRADIDGDELEIYRYYNAMRAVRVPPGSHTVQFHYEPSSAYWGAALSATGLLFCLGAFGLVFFRRGDR